MKPGGPIQDYRALLSSGRIASDPAQALAVEKLQLLWMQLTPRGFSLWPWSSSRADLKGLYLYGGVGRGKTMLMDLFFATVREPQKRRVHFNAFMADVHDRIAIARETVPGDPIPTVGAGIAEEARLLCLDEFQVTDIADAMILGRLFEALFANGTVLVTTSNTAPRNLYKDGLNRQLFLPFIAMLDERLDTLELAAARDYRMDKLRGHALWFSPLGLTAESEMDAAWSRLTLGAEASPLLLQVKGRTVTLPRAALGTAMVPFAALCEQPLGAGDYLAIAQACHTLLLTEIPVLTPEMRGAARRFIVLVDTLYDTHTRLIASAAADPDALYQVGDGATDFARTASRLMEMRSEAYLAGTRAA
jgi:cell division protein ZapE